jgi:U3 small nucleolar RNA-associated protein 14
MFRCPPTANKVSLADILATRPSLKQSASALLKPPTTSTSTLRQGTLNAPLPTVVTERLAREAAYEATKAEGDKWGGVMKRIKEAEHLSFPLQGAKGGKERQRGGVKSAGDLVGSFKVSIVSLLVDS